MCMGVCVSVDVTTAGLPPGHGQTRPQAKRPNKCVFVLPARLTWKRCARSVATSMTTLFSLCGRQMGHMSAHDTGCIMCTSSHTCQHMIQDAISRAPHPNSPWAHRLRRSALMRSATCRRAARTRIHTGTGWVGGSADTRHAWPHMFTCTHAHTLGLFGRSAKWVVEGHAHARTHTHTPGYPTRRRVCWVGASRRRC